METFEECKCVCGCDRWFACVSTSVVSFIREQKTWVFALQEHMTFCKLYVILVMLNFSFSLFHTDFLISACHSHTETPPPHTHFSHHTNCLFSVVIPRDISITEALLQFAQHKVRLVPRCYMGTLNVAEEFSCILQ